MIELQGKHNTAKVFTDNIDSETISQIITLLNQPYAAESDIRIMPDCHSGAGCVIGTTMTLKSKVCPNLVGVDLGCGMLTVQLKEKKPDIDLKELDEIIQKHVPSGFNVHDDALFKTPLDCRQLKCFGKAGINDTLAYRSVGTLGGGNHFIELDKDPDGSLYLVVHTGSRHLGLEVAHYYQNLAWECLTDLRRNYDFQSKKHALIEKLQSEGKQATISKAVQRLYADYRANVPATSKDLAYVEGADFDDYIHDMKLVQEHACANRAAIADAIMNHMGWHETDRFETIHNYIDTDNMILRKGAVSAQKGERLLIPMNMRDGSLICTGRGNPDWNFSAPHGAGRILSRAKAKEVLNMADFAKTMEGIYSTSVSETTLDESPMVYKPMQEIMENIKDTVIIEKIIKPVYNFKAH